MADATTAGASTPTAMGSALAATAETKQPVDMGTDYSAIFKKINDDNQAHNQMIKDLRVQLAQAEEDKTRAIKASKQELAQAEENMARALETSKIELAKAQEDRARSIKAHNIKLAQAEEDKARAIEDSEIKLAQVEENAARAIEASKIQVTQAEAEKAISIEASKAEVAVAEAKVKKAELEETNQKAKIWALQVQIDTLNNEKAQLRRLYDQMKHIAEGDRSRVVALEAEHRAEIRELDRTRGDAINNLRERTYLLSENIRVMCTLFADPRGPYAAVLAEQGIELRQPQTEVAEETEEVEMLEDRAKRDTEGDAKTSLASEATKELNSNTETLVSAQIEAEIAAADQTSAGRSLRDTINGVSAGTVTSDTGVVQSGSFETGNGKAVPANSSSAAQVVAANMSTDHAGPIAPDTSVITEQTIDETDIQEAETVQQGEKRKAPRGRQPAKNKRPKPSDSKDPLPDEQAGDKQAAKPAASKKSKATQATGGRRSIRLSQSET